MQWVSIFDNRSGAGIINRDYQVEWQKSFAVKSSLRCFIARGSHPIKISFSTKFVDKWIAMRQSSSTFFIPLFMMINLGCKNVTCDWKSISSFIFDAFKLISQAVGVRRLELAYRITTCFVTSFVMFCRGRARSLTYHLCRKPKVFILLHLSLSAKKKKILFLILQLP
jgi:hypothetical protein